MSYLTKRKQYVTIAGITSELQLISFCVPQGSLLRPLLFLPYINDLNTAINYYVIIHIATINYYVIIHIADDNNSLIKNK